MKAQSGRAVLVLALALVLGVQLLLPGLARAGGIGVAPVEIEVNEALRGGEYQRTVMFMNQEATDITFLVTTEGEAGQWASLHRFEEPAVSLDRVLVPAGTDARLLLRVAVPKDAANGPHQGALRFQSDISGRNQEGSQMGVSIGVLSNLKIDVTGTQRLAGVVLDMATDDVEVDQPPLRVKTTFQNTGNVKAAPIVDLQVRGNTGGIVGQASYNSVAVDPGDVQRISSEWDHSGKPAGSYLASVTVRLGDAEVERRELKFQVLPRGALTRSGALDRFTLDSEAQVGAVTKVTGRFQNTGKIDTRAILTVELYRESALLKVVESRERLVPVGEMANLEAFLEIPKAGKYVVRGKVGFEGKVTETMEVAFDAGLSSEVLPAFVWSLLGGGMAAGVALIGGVGWLAVRRARRPSPRD